MATKEGRSRTIKSRIRELPKQGDGTRALVPCTTVLPRHLEDRRVKTLVRSLSELDEWLVAIIHRSQGATSFHKPFAARTLAVARRGYKMRRTCRASVGEMIATQPRS